MVVQFPRGIKLRSCGGNAARSRGAPVSDTARRRPEFISVFVAVSDTCSHPGAPATRGRKRFGEAGVTGLS
jgi:hypothetical protein